MNKLKKLIDRIIFLVISVVVLILLVFWRGCDMMIGTGPGIGTPGVNQKQQEPTKEPGSTATPNDPKSDDTDVKPTSELPNVVKLYLGRKGVSEDQETWCDLDDFADFIQQLQDRGVKEVLYTLLPDSIPRYEEKWEAELDKVKANMRSYIDTD